VHAVWPQDEDCTPRFRKSMLSPSFGGELLDLIFFLSSSCRIGSYLYSFAPDHAKMVARGVRSINAICKGRSNWEGAGWPIFLA